MNDRERKKFVKKLRASLANKVDRTRWEEISGGLVAKIPFQENINNLLHDFYTYIENDQDEYSKYIKNVVRKTIITNQDKDTFRLIAEMVPLQDFEKRILPDVYDRCADDSIQKCKGDLVKEGEIYYRKIFFSSRRENRIPSSGFLCEEAW